MVVVRRVNLHDTLGALEIGAFIAIYLFGVVTTQADTYFRSYPEDKLVFKALVRRGHPHLAFIAALTRFHKQGCNSLDVGASTFVGGGL